MSSLDQPEPPPPRVFISYSQHDPVGHSRRVRAFAQALADDGLDVELDQYHQNQPVDWPRWCEERLRKENSDFVLMICSAEYKNRIENRVPADKGRGVFWEGSIIDDYLYDTKANERFIPILLDNENEESLPRIVRGWTWFKVTRFGIASGEIGYSEPLSVAHHATLRRQARARKAENPSVGRVFASGHHLHTTTKNPPIFHIPHWVRYSRAARTLLMQFARGLTPAPGAQAISVHPSCSRTRWNWQDAGSG